MTDLFKGCTLVSSEDIKAAIGNYKVQKQHTKDAIKDAWEWIDENIKVTWWDRVWDWNATPRSKVRADFSMFGTEAGDLEDIVPWFNVEDHYPVLNHWGYFVWEDTVYCLQALAEAGSSVHVTPNQAMFINKFN